MLLDLLPLFDEATTPDPDPAPPAVQSGMGGLSHRRTVSRRRAATGVGFDRARTTTRAAGCKHGAGQPRLTTASASLAAGIKNATGEIRIGHLHVTAAEGSAEEEDDVMILLDL